MAKYCVYNCSTDGSTSATLWKNTDNYEEAKTAWLKYNNNGYHVKLVSDITERISKKDILNHKENLEKARAEMKKAEANYEEKKNFYNSLC